MSFGDCLSDCMAILQLANKVRERFVGAPEEYKAISNETTSLSIVVRDIQSALSRQVLADYEKDHLAHFLQECHNSLTALVKLVDENSQLNVSDIHGLRDKSRRVWKRLTWEQENIQKLRSRIALNVAFLNAFNGSLIRKDTLEIKEGVQRLHERYDRQDRRERDEEDQGILDWLTPLDYAPQQHDFISRRQVGTGQWLLDSVEYQAWLNADKQTLFCPGIPGAGKTILTSIVIEDLQTRFQTNSSIAIAYIYCNFNFKQSDEQKLDDLLLSLLKQLAQGRLELPDVVRSLHDQHVRHRKRPSTDEISKTLYSVTSIFSKVFIVIDALDECQVNHSCEPNLLSEIFNLQAKFGANIFATSRPSPLPEITEYFKTGARLEIRASDNDLRRYLDGQMPRLQKYVSELPDLQEKIKDVIVKTVDGMFLLAQLYMESLRDKRTPWILKNALKDLPKGSNALDIAYEEAIRRIKGQERGFAEVAWRVLSWITCAERPLTSKELEHALAVEAGDSELRKDNLQEIEDIAPFCAGLVIIDEESDIVRLVHYTTQEYFVRNSSFPDAQDNIAEVCITYLSFSAFEAGFCPTKNEFEKRLRLHPFYSYTARYWGNHASAASTKVEQLTLDFLKIEQKVLAAGQAMIASFSHYTEREPGQLTGVHLAEFFELNKAILALFEHGHHIDTKDNYGQTPLSWAAENGHAETASLLLQMGAEIESIDNYGQRPLLWAIRNGHENAARRLLEKGAEIDFKDKNGGTLLSWAARKGHESEMKLLLDMGAEIESKDKNGQSPLLWAARNGHEGAAGLLLEKGSEIDSRDNDGRMPISWAVAVEKGHEGVVRLLLENGADFDSKDNGGRTPLSWAAKNGHETLVRLLLEKGADFESRDNKRRTPLVWAVGRKHTAVERLLRERGAKLDT